VLSGISISMGSSGNLRGSIPMKYGIIDIASVGKEISNEQQTRYAFRESSGLIKEKVCCGGKGRRYSRKRKEEDVHTEEVPHARCEAREY